MSGGAVPLSFDRAMTTLELARWQFAITTLFHFLFVPTSIGLAFLTAIYQTRWHRSGDERFKRLTKLFGKLTLVSFAVGVATGIVQEFQFGMNWSEYSRYVGDVFGAPLAMEGLAAFFLESTFLGLWMFGWGRLSPRIHLACIWLLSIGTLLSAYFILAANSWMQHPVGYEIDAATGRAQLTDIFAVLFSSTTLWAFGHTVLAAGLTGALVVLAVSAYHLLRGNQPDLFRPAARVALVVACVAALATAATGHFQGMLATEQQPMKMAAAAAHYETEEGAGLSLFAVGDWERNPGPPFLNVLVPKLESFLATGDPDGRFEGINDIQRSYEQRYGPGDYVPIVGMSYWSFRIMVGAGTLLVVLTLAGLWLERRRSIAASPWFLRLAIVAAAIPYIANSAGWILREVGRQPWIVFGLMATSDGVSPHVSTTQVVLSFGAFVVLYGVLIVVAGGVFLRLARKGAPPPDQHPPGDERTLAPDLSLTY